MDALLDWYEPQLERIYEDAPLRAADLAQLRRIAGTYPSRERFLTELTLDPPAATSAEAGAPLIDEDYLTLSTIHSAKGQEWKSVAILNCVDGCIPSDMATGRADTLEEELRLLYVAMTRAKDHLALVLPHRFYVRQQSGGGDRQCMRCAAAFSRQRSARGWNSLHGRRTDALATGTPSTAGARIDVGARVRSAWSRA
jgi:DNA helicase-2/ATP-dependent DNA helicase PcrA